jgi:5'-methylthioadenosine phosphorylase
MVTDFDCWHPAHDAVTVDAVIQVLLANAQAAKTLVAGLAGTITQDPQAAACSCRQALSFALITAPDARDPAMVQKLQGVAGRVLKPAA